MGSKAGTWPFGRYKSSTWREQKIWSSFSDLTKTTTTYSFGAKNVFDLQFGQYSPLIEELKNRKDEDGVLIAGTYIQYFLHNQKNITLDGLLSQLREQMSDYNSCKTYHRLKNNHIKYLVIDPNIGTVWRVWAGNESLFHRFFAKLDSTESKVQTHGALTMLARFAQDGYLKLFFTNNIGAKYAVAKFFITQQDTSLLEHINQIFIKRLDKAEGLDDLANILNKKIDAQKLYAQIPTITGGAWLSNLSDDEKIVIAQYLILGQMIKAGQASTQISQLIQESIFGNSQIITLEML